MMYLAFTPRSNPDDGTIVALSEKITIGVERNLAFYQLSIGLHGLFTP
jgi:hypothetical protein